MNLEKKSIEIISDILGIDESEIKQALHSPEYAFFKIPKKTGGLRDIHAPEGFTKTIQERINKSLLKKMHRNGLIHKNCFGSIPTKSIIDNVSAHTFIVSDYVFKIDLKDAFHCVDKKTVEELFYDVFLLEIREYRKRYLKSLLFKNRSDEQDDVNDTDDSTETESLLDDLPKYEELLFDISDRNENHFDSEPTPLWNYWPHVDDLTDPELQYLNILSQKEDLPFDVPKKADDPLGVASDPPWDYWRRLEWNARSGDRILYPRTFKNSILFPNKKVKNFRSMVSHVNYLKDVDALLHSMSSMLAELTTCNGKLVQGCPTSPLLMALAVTKTDLLRKLSNYVLGSRYAPGSFPVTYTGQSVYVDDITFSFNSSGDNNDILKRMLSGIKEIEKSTFWKFNRKKIMLYQVSKTQPLITGLRLVTHRKTKQELKQMAEDKIKGATWRLRAWEPWYYLRPTIPKTLQRKIRAIIHQACISHEDGNLQNRARSYIGYVFNIYSKYEHIPLQIRKPIDVYLQNNGLLVHHQVPEKTNKLKRIKIRTYKLKM